MSSRHLVPIVLLLLLGLLQYQIWTGRGSVQQVHTMQVTLAKQQLANAELEVEIARLKSEISDLKDGLDTVEEKARFELGMVKPNEIFVQIVRQ